MNKKCRNCGEAELSVRPENHLYKECGLPNVVLVGIDVRRCASCGHYELVLPRVQELHKTIAHALVHKQSRLGGAEIRYLRKYLGWSGEEFGRHAGVTASTVSNWETDKDPIGAASDRLLRLMVMHGSPVEDYSLEELTKIESDCSASFELRISPKARGWERVERAA